MSKLSKLLQVLDAVNDSYVILNEAGIDVDELVGLSKTQSEVSRRIRAAIPILVKEKPAKKSRASRPVVTKSPARNTRGSTVHR